MTIRQLYYTSCERGTEGIQGFQVNASSAGIDRSHTDSGLRLSLYRPSPAAPSLPTPAQLDELPVALGYRPFGDFAVLFHSRYLGADFTGRQGNYFAHVLVLDAPERDLAGVLPIDAWRGGEWRWARADGAQLPELPAPPRGGLERFSVGDHLRRGAMPEFGPLLTAVVEGLDHPDDRIVLVAPTDDAVAHAVAAVTRSLPRGLATAVSFITFTSAPGEADLLIAGTSADVQIQAGPLGTRTVLRLGRTAGADAGDVGRYAQIMAECWLRSDDEALEAIALGSAIRPALEASELDRFAHLVALIVPDAPQRGSDLDLLTALEFGLRRCPSVLRPQVWARVARHVEAGTPIADVTRWSEVLRAALAAGIDPPPALMRAYLMAALDGAARDGLDLAPLWIPERMTGSHERTALAWADAALDRNPSFEGSSVVLDTLARVRVGLPTPTLEHLVARVVVPQLLERETAARAAKELDRMASSTPALLGLVCAEVDRRTAGPSLFRAAAEAMPIEAAELLGPRAAAGTRCALLLDVVAARAGRRGRVGVLRSALGHGGSPADVQMYTDLIWLQPPTAEEGVALCRAVPSSVLAATRVPARLAKRLVADATGDGLTDHDFDLADELTLDPVIDALGDLRRDIRALGFAGYFESDRTKPTTDDAIDAVDSVDGVVPEVRKTTLLAVASWLITTREATTHADILAQVLRAARDPREFVGAYRARLIDLLRTGTADDVARVLPVLAGVSVKFRDVESLLDTTAAMVLTGRSKRDREAITRAFGHHDRAMRPLLRSLGRKAPKSWPVWWDEWQQSHLRTSLVSRLVARRRSAKVAD